MATAGVFAGCSYAQAANTGHNAFVKPIVGSWFEFEHHNQREGKYWNPVVSKWTTEQWKSKIKEMHQAGMEYLVMLAVAYDGKTYYPSELQPRHDYACPDPLEAVLDAADECGVKFFVSNDYWSDWRQPGHAMVDKEIGSLREKGMEEVAEKYAHHKSFYGWYYPHESGFSHTIDDATIHYVNRCSQKAKSLTPKALTLIAPYGTKRIRPDANFMRQLERLDVDIMAYQDEVGVGRIEAGSAGKHFEGLYHAHAKVGKARLWADVEIFDFEGEAYRSALIPASFERVRVQLEDVSPFVEHILIYSYLGMMNQPGSKASTGHIDSEKLYVDYINWLNKPGF